MATITDKLNQLENDRQDLVDNLETMGVTGLTGDETFTELVPEVLNIPAGADLSDYFTSTINSNNIKTLIKNIPDNTSITGTNASSLFESCSSLTTIPLINTSNITNMGNMFRSCTSLTSVPLLDTSNVTKMSYMFQSCSSLTTIPLFNTSNVTDMTGMFQGCSSLTTIPLFNTSNVAGMSGMFGGCTNLTTIPQLDTSKANIGSMFGQCRKFTNETMNNVLAMCTNATQYTGTKTLRSVFGNFSLSYEYPVSMIQGLSNYQAFIDAGWTIGW